MLLFQFRYIHEICQQLPTGLWAHFTMGLSGYSNCTTSTSPLNRLRCFLICRRNGSHSTKHNSAAFFQEGPHLSCLLCHLIGSLLSVNQPRLLLLVLRWYIQPGLLGTKLLWVTDAFFTTGELGTIKQLSNSTSPQQFESTWHLMLKTAQKNHYNWFFLLLIIYPLISCWIKMIHN